MTRHIVNVEMKGKTVAKVTVVAGWDRPLGGYFCQVTGSRGRYLYSNTADIVLLGSCGMTDDLSYYVEKLADMGISLPPQMVAELETDARENRGNAVVRWDDQGNKVPAEVTAQPSA